MGAAEQATAFLNSVESDTTPALLRRLTEVTIDLMSAQRELGQLLRAEAQQRSYTYMNSQVESVSGRDRESDFAVLDLHMDIVEHKCIIEAYHAEIDALKTILDFRGSNASHSE